MQITNRQILWIYQLSTRQKNRLFVTLNGSTFGLFVRKAIIVILVAHATIRHAADLRGIIFKIILEIRHFFGLLLYW